MTMPARQDDTDFPGAGKIRCYICAKPVRDHSLTTSCPEGDTIDGTDEELHYMLIEQSRNGPRLKRRTGQNENQEARVVMEGLLSRTPGPA